MFEYEVKVRERTFLWGGAEITSSLKSSMLLTSHVSIEGETIRIR